MGNCSVTTASFVKVIPCWLFCLHHSNRLTATTVRWWKEGEGGGRGGAGDYTWSMLGARTLFWAGLGNTWGGGRCVAGIVLPLFARGSSGERGNSTRAASARWKSLHWLRAVIQHKLIAQIKVSPPFGWRKRQGQGHTCTCNKHRPTQS